MAKETIDVAKSHTSWMNFKDNREFQDIERNPFNFTFIKAISTLEEYRELASSTENESKPLMLITSAASLNQGFSRQILREFASEAKNEIVFVEKLTGGVTKESLAGELFQRKTSFLMEEIKAVKPQTQAKDEAE